VTVTTSAAVARSLVCLVAALGVGCATTPAGYRYRPAVPIAAADRDACHAQADAAVQVDYRRYTEIVELAGPFGGPFGGVTLGQRAWEARDDVLRGGDDRVSERPGLPGGQAGTGAGHPMRRLVLDRHPPGE
jgi:hypothetical protein